MRDQTIDSFEGDYRFLSNFSDHGFSFMGLWYPTNEHFYQAAKAVTHEDAQIVAWAETPGKSKRAGRRIIVRRWWDYEKVDVMRLGLRLKFSPGRDITDQLLDTGYSELIEGNTWGDTYWGVCDGKGENMLGRLLMELRDEYRLGLV